MAPPVPPASVAGSSSSATQPDASASGPFVQHYANQLEMQSECIRKPRASNFVTRKLNARFRDKRQESLVGMQIVDFTRIGILLLTVSYIFLNKTAQLNQSSAFWVVVLGIYSLLGVLAYLEKQNIWSEKFL